MCVWFINPLAWIASTPKATRTFSRDRQQQQPSAVPPPPADPDVGTRSAAASCLLAKIATGMCPWRNACHEGSPDSNQRQTLLEGYIGGYRPIVGSGYKKGDDSGVGDTQKSCHRSAVKLLFVETLLGCVGRAVSAYTSV